MKIGKKLREKLINMIISEVVRDPKKKEEVKKIAKKIAKMDWSISEESRSFVLDFTDVIKDEEKAGWKVVILVDRENRRGLVLEV